MRAVVGPVKAGKTSALVGHARALAFAGRAPVILSPEVDTRSPLFTHCGVDAGDVVALVRKVGQGADYAAVTEGATDVLADEGQFLPPGIVEALARDPRPVTVYGIDMDYLGRGIGSMPEILSRAAAVQKLTARCDGCGAPARFSRRLTPQTEVVLVGEGIYSPRCAACFVA